MFVFKLQNYPDYSFSSDVETISFAFENFANDLKEKGFLASFGSRLTFDVFFVVREEDVFSLLSDEEKMKLEFQSALIDSIARNPLFNKMLKKEFVKND